MQYIFWSTLDAQVIALPPDKKLEKMADCCWSLTLNNIGLSWWLNGLLLGIFFSEVPLPFTKNRSFEVNKSIAISVIDRIVHQWLTAKLTFSQTMRMIWLVTSDGVNNIDSDGLIRYNTKTTQIWQNWFQSSKSTWRSTSTNLQNDRCLDQEVLHHLSNFGDSGFNRWWVMVGIISKWG